MSKCPVLSDAPSSGVDNTLHRNVHGLTHNTVAISSHIPSGIHHQTILAPFQNGGMPPSTNKAYGFLNVRSSSKPTPRMPPSTGTLQSQGPIRPESSQPSPGFNTSEEVASTNLKLSSDTSTSALFETSRIAPSSGSNRTRSVPPQNLVENTSSKTINQHSLIIDPRLLSRATSRPKASSVPSGRATTQSLLANIQLPSQIRLVTGDPREKIVTPSSSIGKAQFINRGTILPWQVQPGSALAVQATVPSTPRPVNTGPVAPKRPFSATLPSSASSAEVQNRNVRQRLNGGQNFATPVRPAIVNQQTHLFAPGTIVLDPRKVNPVRRRESQPLERLILTCPSKPGFPYGRRDNELLYVSDPQRWPRGNYEINYFATLRPGNRYLDPKEGASPPGTCAEDQRYFHGQKDFVECVMAVESDLELKQTHAGAIKWCQYHPRDPTKRPGHEHAVCLTCRVASDVYLRRNTWLVQAPVWWPLCRACGEEAMRRKKASQDRRLGCHCGAGWSCHSCRVESLEVLRARTLGEEDIRGINFGRCRCGGNVCDGTVRVLVCPGCEGLAWGAWNWDEWEKLEERLKQLKENWT